MFFRAKGQLISKCLFCVFNFFQKTNKNTSQSSKNEFVCSFFGRINGLTICFRNYLTFSAWAAGKKKISRIIFRYDSNFLAWIIWIHCRIEFWCEYFEELNMFWIKMTCNRCSLLFYPLELRKTKKLRKQKLKCWVFMNIKRILVQLFQKKTK